jgi:glycosyltransferase involved in cell wall biosynthesis
MCHRQLRHLGRRYTRPVHTISVVIPTYRGELTLAATVAEVLLYASESKSPAGAHYRVIEVILVDDNGPDSTDQVMRSLAASNALVHTVWLSKNYGQHAATLAGMASSAGDWVVTIDEDGQQDPRDIGSLLDAALEQSAQVVYGRPLNAPPHSLGRNAASRTSKWIVTWLSGSQRALDFNSYRLILGSVARGVAAYAGPNVYLDVALGWVAGRYTTAGITLRGEQRVSGYSTRALLSHFWRLVIASGTRALRLVSVAGVMLALVGIVIAVSVVIQKLAWGIDSAGWASIMVIMLLGIGAILFSLGIIAEYIGANVNMAMGKPAYFLTTDPADGPLGRRDTP